MQEQAGERQMREVMRQLMERFLHIILVHILFSLTRNRRTQAETKNQTKVQNVAVVIDFCWLVGCLAINGGFFGGGWLMAYRRNRTEK